VKYPLIAGTVCGVAQFHKIEYCTCVTHFGNTTGLPIPVLNPTALVSCCYRSCYLAVTTLAILLLPLLLSCCHHFRYLAVTTLAILLSLLSLPHYPPGDESVIRKTLRA
jgi:hypothetical protein